VPNISSRRARVPHSAGDFTPAGGGRYLPSVLNTWPMKPPGVQLARPIFPPGLQTRVSSPAALSWSAVNITPKVETTTSKRAPALEQRLHVIGRGHRAPAARRRERHVAVAGRHVQHFAAGAKIECFTELLAYDLQGRADDGVIAGRPGDPLTLLDGREVG